MGTVTVVAPVAMAGFFDLEVGKAGVGTLTVTDGGHVEAGSGSVGSVVTSAPGTVIVDGPDSLLSITGDLNVGIGPGTGRLTILFQGGVSVGGTLTVGSKGVLDGHSKITGNVSNGGTVLTDNGDFALHIVATTRKLRPVSCKSIWEATLGTTDSSSAASAHSLVPCKYF